jgi:hypothetical protein
VAIGILLTSFADDRTPASQSRTESALLEGAALGEAHLHVSTLRGPVVGFGAYHRNPAQLLRGGVAGWRRRTGGRSVACGDGFLVLTLALPHRSALIAGERQALRPEQVMNRCVRGVLAWLRGLGVEPIYPGLDTVTVGRRWLAHLSFAETDAGPTLFQAIVARDGTFARTPALLDRLDPEGRIPIRLVASDEATSLAACAPHARAASGGFRDLGGLVAGVGAGYARAFGVEVAELDPAVTELLAAQGGALDEIPPPLVLDGTPAAEQGLLGPVFAGARVAAGGVAELALSGDFVAPDGLVPALRAAIEGGAAAPDDVIAAVDRVVDGSRLYLLGLAPDALRRLLARAVREAR